MCEHDCGNYVTNDHPCECRGWEEGSSEESFDSGDGRIAQAVHAPRLMSDYTEAELEEMRENSNDKHEDGRGRNDNGSDEDGGFASEEY